MGVTSNILRVCRLNSKESPPVYTILSFGYTRSVLALGGAVFGHIPGFVSYYRITLTPSCVSQTTLKQVFIISHTTILLNLGIDTCYSRICSVINYYWWINFELLQQIIEYTKTIAVKWSASFKTVPSSLEADQWRPLLYITLNNKW